MNRNSAIRLAKYHLGVIKKEKISWIRFSSIISMLTLVKQYNLSATQLGMLGYEHFLKSVQYVSRKINSMSEYCLKDSLPTQKYTEEE